jgi:hypothetical protein
MGKQKIKETKTSSFSITRDGDLIGSGLSFEDAVQITKETSSSYPESTFKIAAMPKSGEKVNP